MIELINVCKYYYPSASVVVKALDNVSLTIQSGEFIALLGPSGSGKSTLLYVIGLLEQPTQGQVRINGKETETLHDAAIATLRGKTIGFIFQQFNLIPKLTILENIVLPVFYSKHSSLPEARTKAITMLNTLGIGDKAYTYPNRLSGGQQQRVAIARALINAPDIIIADEPTGNLDSNNGKQIMDLLSSIHVNEKKTVILVTHDTSVAKYAHRIIRLQDGKITSG